MVLVSVRQLNSREARLRVIFGIFCSPNLSVPRQPPAGIALSFDDPELVLWDRLINSADNISQDFS